MHIMIDLETMGLDTDSAIVALGAVRFDPVKKEVFNASPGGTFYKIISLKSAVRCGGKIDPGTVMWWMQQSEAARSQLFGGEGILIESALKEFADWVRVNPLEGLWGNGAGFDNVLLTGAYARLGWTPPWTHRQDMCYRTIKKLKDPLGEKFVRWGTYHNALDDAISQAEHLCKIL